MKKVYEMNRIEKIALRNIKDVFNWEVGGWFNCIQDDCPEYIPDTYEEAFATVYEESLNDTARNGYFGTGKAPREMRFAGEKFIEECLVHLFKTDDDVKEIAAAKGWNMNVELTFEVVKE